MNTLPEDIQETIYKYKHQLEFKNVMNHLKDNYAYCGLCCKWMRVDKELCSDCWDRYCEHLHNPDFPERLLYLYEPFFTDRDPALTVFP